jgi:uncharacterized membrane protein YqjE
MAEDNADTTDATLERPTGILASLQRLLGSFAEILHTRVDILALDLEEAGWLIGRLILYVLISVFFLGLGLLVLTLFIVKASPETYQLYVLGGFAILYLSISVIAVLLVRHKLKTRSRLFSTTLSELDKDRKRLGGRR